MHEVAYFIAGAPNLVGIELLDGLADESRDDVAGNRVEIVVPPIHGGGTDERDLHL